MGQPSFGSFNWQGYVVSKGRGTVYSFAEVHHPQFPIFDYPLLAVLVELEEGTRILSNLIGVSGGDPTILCETRTARSPLSLSPDRQIIEFREVGEDGRPRQRFITRTGIEIAEPLSPELFRGTWRLTSSPATP